MTNWGSYPYAGYPVEAWAWGKCSGAQARCPRTLELKSYDSWCSILLYFLFTYIMYYVDIGSSIIPWRSHPMVLPHTPIPYLHSKNIWPLHNPREIRRYWNHIRSAGDSDLGKISPNNDHVPLWFWGDGVECNEQFSVVVLAFGSCLDQRTHSLDFCYPLTFVREESWKKTFRLMSKKYFLGFLWFTFLGVPNLDIMLSGIYPSWLRIMLLVLLPLHRFCSRLLVPLTFAASLRIQSPSEDSHYHD